MKLENDKDLDFLKDISCYELCESNGCLALPGTIQVYAKAKKLEIFYTYKQARILFKYANSYKKYARYKVDAQSNDEEIEIALLSDLIFEIMICKYTWIVDLLIELVFICFSLDNSELYDDISKTTDEKIKVLRNKEKKSTFRDIAWKNNSFSDEVKRILTSIIGNDKYRELVDIVKYIKHRGLIYFVDDNYCDCNCKALFINDIAQLYNAEDIYKKINKDNTLEIIEHYDIKILIPKLTSIFTLFDSKYKVKI